MATNIILTFSLIFSSFIALICAIIYALNENIKNRNKIAQQEKRIILSKEEMLNKRIKEYKNKKLGKKMKPKRQALNVTIEQLEKLIEELKKDVE